MHFYAILFEAQTKCQDNFPTSGEDVSIMNKFQIKQVFI